MTARLTLRGIIVKYEIGCTTEEMGRRYGCHATNGTSAGVSAFKASLAQQAFRRKKNDDSGISFLAPEQLVSLLGPAGRTCIGSAPLSASRLRQRQESRSACPFHLEFHKEHPNQFLAHNYENLAQRLLLFRGTSQNDFLKRM